MKKNFQKKLLKEREQIVDILRQSELLQIDPEIYHKLVIPYASYSPWETDQPFNVVFELIKEHTLVDIYRCYELWTLVQDLNDLSGDILEVGVWRGGTGAIMCSAVQNSNTKIYLADTFEGVVKASEEDMVYRGGEHSDTSEEIVNELLLKLKLNNYKILKGIFPDDHPQLKLDIIKLCHIDVDTYQSAKEVFDFVWPLVPSGGVVVFDDYGFWTCEGVTKYFNSIHVDDGRKIHNLNGHGLVIKL